MRLARAAGKPRSWVKGRLRLFAAWRSLPWRSGGARDWGWQ